jgi:4-amino-4-deoxychorismate lyase
VAGDARATSYGDGLFETMRVHRSAVPWRDAHWARLELGAKRLALTLPARALVDAAATALYDDGGDGVLKLLVSRGGGGRGYAPVAGAAPVWRVSRHAMPAPARTGGLVLRWCELRLSVQPALAGLKHCNRLEQVLARAEWNDPGIDEGLLRDVDGHVVCATSANLFVLHGQRWSTPALDRCGVAGVCRAFVLQATGAMEARLSPEDVRTADAVLLCNAVRGILPVARLDARAWAMHPAVAGLQRELARAHPAFPSPQELA